MLEFRSNRFHAASFVITVSTSIQINLLHTLRQDLLDLVLVLREVINEVVPVVISLQ
jgi:hypothetical protein